MYDKAIEVLQIFNERGYVAYIVGGYPRDMLLGIKTCDIDICTSATPKEIMEIFDTESVSDIKYGYVRVIYKKYAFDVTTFRKDIKYENNRKPIEIKYITDLKKDLFRRDFTINTLCIDSNGEIIDLLNGREDIERRIIRTVGNPKHKLEEDSLRILRAIRFASILDFDIEEKTKDYIKKYGYLLKNLSGARKREELDKILTSKNREKGRYLIIQLGLDKYLGLDNLSNIVLCDDIIGIWSQISGNIDLPFSKLERDSIKKIRDMLKEDISDMTIYKYGLYTSQVVASIKGYDYKKTHEMYEKLPIYSKKDIQVSGMEIAKALKREPGNYLSEITNDIEEKIVTRKLENNRDKIMDYIVSKY